MLRRNSYFICILYNFFLSPALCLINDIIPMIAFIGVRISCDILDKKSVFALFAFSAVCRASIAMFLAFFQIFISFFHFAYNPLPEAHCFFFQI